MRRVQLVVGAGILMMVSVLAISGNGLQGFGRVEATPASSVLAVSNVQAERAAVSGQPWDAVQRLLLGEKSPEKAPAPQLPSFPVGAAVLLFAGMFATLVAVKKVTLRPSES